MRFLLALIFSFSIFQTLEPICLAESPDQYKIGVLLPLSGEAAGLGNYLRKGINLAYDSLPKESKDKIKLVFEDDQLKPPQSVELFHKVKDVDSVNAVFALGSGVGNAISPLAEKSKTLFIAIGASDSKIASDKRYSFTHWVTPETESKELAKEISLRGYSKLALVTHEQEGALAITNSLVKDLESAGLKNRIVFNENVLLDVRDFGSLITKIRSRNADAVYVALLPGALSSFAKQLRTQAPNISLFGIEVFEDESEVKASAGALVGKWYVNADQSDKSFENLYRTKYNEHPGWGAANAYDTLNIVAKAVSLYGNDNDKIASYLSSLKNYSGACGMYSATGDNRFTLPAAIKVVTNSGFEKLVR